MWDLGTQEFDATGVVEPVEVWSQTADGRRVRTGEQEVSADGFPLWQVGITRLVQTRFGGMQDESMLVRVPARTMPTVVRHQGVKFAGVVLDAYVSNSKLRWSLSATSVQGSTAAPADK